MLKRFLQGLVSLAVGISVLAYTGIIDGVRDLTISSLDSIARNPSLYPQLKFAFLQGITHEFLIFLAISVIIVSLMLALSRYYNSRINLGLYTLGASISVLVGSNLGNAIGSTTGAYIEAYARNPATESFLKEILLLGNAFATIPFAAAAVVSIYLLLFAFRFFRGLFVFEPPKSV